MKDASRSNIDPSLVLTSSTNCAASHRITGTGGKVEKRVAVEVVDPVEVAPALFVEVGIGSPGVAVRLVVPAPAETVWAAAV